MKKTAKNARTAARAVLEDLGNRSNGAMCDGEIFHLGRSPVHARA